MLQGIAKGGGHSIVHSTIWQAQDPEFHSFNCKEVRMNSIYLNHFVLLLHTEPKASCVLICALPLKLPSLNGFQGP